MTSDVEHVAAYRPFVVQFLRIRKEILEKVEQTRKRGCSSAGRAPALQAGGHGFEPHHLHQSAVPTAKIDVTHLKTIVRSAMVEDGGGREGKRFERTRYTEN